MILIDFQWRLKSDENEQVLLKKEGYSLGIFPRSEAFFPEVTELETDRCLLRIEEL